MSQRLFSWLSDGRIEPLRKLGSWLEQALSRRPESPEVTAEYLRLNYRNLSVSSPVSLVMVIYLTLQAGPQPTGVLQVWATIFSIYLVLRWTIGLAYPRQGEVDPADVPLWSATSILIQGSNGVLLAALALWILPTLDPYAQVVATMVVLILVGAIAFSLAGRWAETLVYAPPIYFSFAWVSAQQEHPYARGVGLLVLALFVLHLIYASNQRKSIVASFAVARRNADLARELQFKNIEFQEVASARSRLLATVSHDLRQPAHAIGLLSERALMDTSFDSVKTALRDLNELSQSLSASLTTLMDLTRLDAGLVRPNVVPVALAQVLWRVEAEFAGSAKGKGLGLHVPPSDLWVRSDPVLLHGVLANLVSNAIKYTRGGHIDIELTQAGEELTVAVCDTGLGIKPDKLGLIFREFVRLDGSEPGTEGLGLGLFIVKRYADLLGHALQVSSQPGKGSRFAIVLPLVRVSASQAESQQLSRSMAADDLRLAGLRVLVVDNMDLVLSSMVRTLSAWGCQVYSGRDMREALLVAQREPLDLVISDFHLGDQQPNGLELIRTLRTLPGRQLSKLPALLMTGDVSGQLEADASGSQVGILHKPVRPAVLQNRVLDLLRGQPG